MDDDVISGFLRLTPIIAIECEPGRQCAAGVRRGLDVLQV
jgi:hypothetical protein